MELANDPSTNLHHRIEGLEEKLFNGQVNGVNTCSVTSNEQKDGIEEMLLRQAMEVNKMYRWELGPKETDEQRWGRRKFW